MELDCLKKELVLSREDFVKLNLTKEQANQKNAMYPILADYAFNCACCEDACPDLNLYRIIKGTLTNFEQARAGMAKRTLAENIKSIEGIFPLDSLNETPEFDSILNWVEGFGYVCDHCHDTVFNDE